jgi:3-phosphoshikimate 1-carboxyvinyltransferase
MMSSKSLPKGLIKSEIHLPSSKSYANRLLIIAATNEKPLTLTRMPVASDVTFLMAALEKIGLSLITVNNTVQITNSFPACEGSGCTIDIGEGGTTARFLAALLCRGHSPYQLRLAGKLAQRPWSEFLDFVRQYGGKAELLDSVLHLQGPLKLPAEVTMDCSRTTQFATAIQLAFPGVRVRPEQLKTSLSYWKLTEHLLQQTATTECYEIPLDWSSASYALAFGALNQEIFFPGLIPDPFQADSKFFDLLHLLGAAEVVADGIKVRPVSAPQEIMISVADALDLVPALAFFLAHLPGIHRLQGVSNLKHKESNRLDGLLELMSKFERNAWVENDELYIEGDQQFVDWRNVVTQPDHRMVMVASLFLRHHSGGEVTPADAVLKSYPNFFELFV